MTKHLFAAAVAVALCFVAGVDRAEAQGFHVQTGRVHIDVGNPHGYGRRSVAYPGYGYGGYGGGYVQRSYYGGGHGAYGPGYGYGAGYPGGHRHGHWHDTSHYDYHAPGFVPHGNHVDYVPGHYDFHREGHWDHH